MKHCLSEAQKPSFKQILYEFEFQVMNMNLDGLDLVSI